MSLSLGGLRQAAADVTTIAGLVGIANQIAH
jgi:hypothetical protein